VGGQVHADFGLEFFQPRFGTGKIDAIRLADPAFDLFMIMLVFDCADNLFDQVFDGDKPVGAAVFVDHQGHVRAFGLHLLQQNAQLH